MGGVGMGGGERGSGETTTHLKLFTEKNTHKTFNDSQVYVTLQE
jgi:hypothetical protein